MIEAIIIGVIGGMALFGWLGLFIAELNRAESEIDREFP
jgi:hypothetical protein